MPDTKTPRIPKYRHFRPKDLAVVRIDGRDYYLGRYFYCNRFRRGGVVDR